MEITIAIAFFSFLAGLIVATGLTIRCLDKEYASGYEEGWLDAKERYIEKLRQIGNQEVIDDFVNSLREP